MGVEITMSDNSRDPLLSAYQREIDRTLGELKASAESLLLKTGLPKRPPRPEPVERVRMRALKSRSFPGPGNTSRVIEPGQEFTADRKATRRLEESGFAETIGPAAPREFPRPAPLIDNSSMVFREWRHELWEGELPEEWRAWGIKEPSDKDRTEMSIAIGYASIIKLLDAEVAAAMRVTYRPGSHAVSENDLTPVVGALSLAVGLLASINPEHLLKGISSGEHLDRVRPGQERAPGIEEMATRVFQPGFTEEEAWQALVAALKGAGDGEVVTVEDRTFTVYVDRAVDDVDCVYQTEEVLENEGADGSEVVRLDERTLTRKSFYPYFKNARDTAPKS